MDYIFTSKFKKDGNIIKQLDLNFSSPNFPITTIMGMIVQEVHTSYMNFIRDMPINLNVVSNYTIECNVLKDDVSIFPAGTIEPETITSVIDPREALLSYCRELYRTIQKLL